MQKQRSNRNAMRSRWAAWESLELAAPFRQSAELVRRKERRTANPRQCLLEAQSIRSSLVAELANHDWLAADDQAEIAASPNEMNPRGGKQIEHIVFRSECSAVNLRYVTPQLWWGQITHPVKAEALAPFMRSMIWLKSGASNRLSVSLRRRPPCRPNGE